MQNLDDIACSDEDIGRINPEINSIITPDVVCPQMVFNKRKAKHATTSYAQCKLRVDEENECTKRCKVARKIRKMLDQRTNW